MFGGTGDDDGVEGGVFGPTEVAVADFGIDGVVAVFLESLGGDFAECLVDFDGIHVGGEFGEDGGLVAGAGADFKDFGVGGDFQDGGHVGDDEGLGDGLVFFDGQGVVVVGEGLLIGGDEPVAGDAFHDIEDFLVVEAIEVADGGDHLSAFGEAFIRARVRGYGLVWFFGWLGRWGWFGRCWGWFGRCLKSYRGWGVGFFVAAGIAKGGGQDQDEGKT